MARPTRTDKRWRAVASSSGPGKLPAPREVSPEIFELYSDANLEREARSLGPVVGQSMEIHQALWEEPFTAPVGGDVVQHFGQRIVQPMLRPARFLKSIAYPYQAEGDNEAYRMFVGPPAG